MLSPFHLAIPVTSLIKANDFYGNVLGLNKGRESSHWIDWNFFGHQLVTHLQTSQKNTISNLVDGHQVPVPHFGVVLPWQDWHNFAKNLQEKKVQFVIEPYIRFKNQAGEQATMFFYDYCGNALEFKAFQDIGQLFAK
ncbi:MAG: glyoxalase [Proteobacteria bacterium]|nr:glyoxalase [Pseudomonadota bacterium]